MEFKKPSSLDEWREFIRKRDSENSSEIKKESSISQSVIKEAVNRLIQSTEK